MGTYALLSVLGVLGMARKLLMLMGRFGELLGFLAVGWLPADLLSGVLRETRRRL